jgi:hypothetical protein
MKSNSLFVAKLGFVFGAFLTAVACSFGQSASVTVLQEWDEPEQNCWWEGGEYDYTYYNDEGEPVIVLTPYQEVCGDPIHHYYQMVQISVSGLDPYCSYTLSTGDSVSGSPSYSSISTYCLDYEWPPTYVDVNLDYCTHTISVSGPSSVAVGGSATFTASIAGDPPGLGITWSGDGVSGSGSTCTASFSSPGVYTVTATIDGEGSSASATITVYQISLDGPASICQSCQATYTATVAPDPGNVTIHWFNNGTPVGTTTGGGSISPQLMFTTTFSITDGGSASASDTTEVVSKTQPNSLGAWGVIAFDPDPGSIEDLTLPGGQLGVVTPFPNGASEIYDVQCNCTCTGYEVNTTFKLGITKYAYDGTKINYYSNLNNSDVANNINRIIADEGQHYTSISNCVSTAQGAASGSSQYTNINACNQTAQTIAAAFYNAFVACYNYNHNLDTTSHPQDGDRIVNGPGF